ncbi:MAG: class I SAM-dependent methyltransferase [Betaproteobacteria bacterium]|nr:class I SAM-dependent methyltransferase [Betaproteobacteria bacterium]
MGGNAPLSPMPSQLPPLFDCLQSWAETAPGRYLLDWEMARISALIADVFGFNALQLGLAERDFLASSRIPLCQRAGREGPIDAFCELSALPFASNSVDLVVLPHVLEFHREPHQILREVERILIPEGQLIIAGFNPHSLWGLERSLRHLSGRTKAFPWHGQYLPLLRVKDWLKLLGFEVERGNFGCYVPYCKNPKWLQHWRFLEFAGDRWWAFAGAVYLLRAVKRVRGMRLILPKWRDSGASSKERSRALARLTQFESPEE